MEKLSDFLQVKEAAEMLGVSVDTLRRWDRAGKISSICHPMNNYRFYRSQDLLAILADMVKGSAISNA